MTDPDLAMAVGDTTTAHLDVNEAFGPVVQGEGRSAGQRAVFLRLARCNLDCVWCDTPYTWDWKNHDRGTELHRLNVPLVGALARRLAGELPAVLVISGGEPLIQGNGLRALIDWLWNNDAQVLHSIEIETNGTRPPLWPHRAGLRYTLSPKLAGSGCDARARAVHDAWHGRLDYDLKFVLTPGATAAELVELEHVRQELDVPRHHVWLMAEGTTAVTQQAAAARTIELAGELGYNYSPRLHVLAYDNQRGT